MNNSELLRRNQSNSSPVIDSPRTPPSSSVKSRSPIRYMLREQRLLFVFVGIAIATLFFNVVRFTFPPELRDDHHRAFNSFVRLDSTIPMRRVLYETRREGPLGRVNLAGRVPPGLTKRNLRIVVTGGAGFVGSHLVDRLIERGDSVIVVDNFFTGRKDNLVHHFGNPRFELIRHDVVQPILLEVDQIYHLACPASPVHYKFNPVKTIISFLFFFLHFLLIFTFFVTNFISNRNILILGLRN
ncbi:hypothetical protein Csa_021708 [Cucumis sativus]|uniref:UDP-glucuronate decarboxylase n=1 Tax=Cucumis sativus TaxID=3659 RepID=A0A0A0KF37_CUCSA|nr:hypothetical protein Csa_021708 [Cucumis sativus]